MSQVGWETICSSEEIVPNIGSRALVNGEQIAIFRIQNKLYAIDNIDPFTSSAVLSRGIVGDLQGQVVVASPIYKQHFNLETGACLEDEAISVKTYEIREEDGKVQIAA